MTLAKDARKRTLIGAALDLLLALATPPGSGSTNTLAIIVAANAAVGTAARRRLRCSRYCARRKTIGTQAMRRSGG